MADEPQASGPARYLIWYLLGVILILLVFQIYSGVKPTTEISYSEFRHLLETKGVNDLTLAPASITGKLLQPASGNWPRSGKNRTCLKSWPNYPITRNPTST